MNKIIKCEYLVNDEDENDDIISQTMMQESAYSLSDVGRCLVERGIPYIQRGCALEYIHNGSTIHVEYSSYNNAYHIYENGKRTNDVESIEDVVEHLGLEHEIYNVAQSRDTILDLLADGLAHIGRCYYRDRVSIEFNEFDRYRGSSLTIRWRVAYDENSRSYTVYENGHLIARPDTYEELLVAIGRI